MKALVEIAMMWGVALAVVLATFLLNFWLVHQIMLLIGIKGAWLIICIAAIIASTWILSFGSKSGEKNDVGSCS
jgi:hypothetical protein|nr:MAG TPA: hypothetical protein [Caudoviricetes sp.]